MAYKRAGVVHCAIIVSAHTITIVVQYSGIAHSHCNRAGSAGCRWWRGTSEGEGETMIDCLIIRTRTHTKLAK